MDRGGIVGVVLDAPTGKPIGGVNVWGPPDDPPGPPAQAPREIAVTESDGTFTLRNLDAGRQSIYFFRPGYISRLLPFAIRDGRFVDGITVRLEPTGVVSGRVFDSRGRPAVNARVRALTRFDDRRWVAYLGAANDRGEFRLSELPPNRYIIAFEAPAQPRFLYTPGQLPTRLPQAEPWSLEDPAAAEVRPILYPGVTSVSRADVVDVVGGEEVRLNAVAMSVLGLGSLRVDFVNAPGEPGKDLEFWIEDTALTAGPNSLGVGGNGVSGKSRIDAGAALSKVYWPPVPGLFRLRARWSDSSGETVEQVETIDFSGENANIAIELGRPDGKLEVRAVAEQSDGSEVPMSGAAATICRPAPSRCLSWNLGTDGVARRNAVQLGRYSLDVVTHLKGDSYVAEAIQGGRDVLLEGIEVSPDSPPLEIRVKSSAGRLQGRVVDGNGEPVGEALVLLMPDPLREIAQLAGLRQTRRPDQDGAFEFERVRPGAYRVLATSRVAPFSDSQVFDTDPDLISKSWESATPVKIEEGRTAVVELKGR